MSTSNQQTLAELGASDRPLILEKGSYVPWASRFRRFLENKQEGGERMQLMFLKTSDPEKTYTTSIMKTEAAWYEIVGIEYMSPKLWSTIKHAYDKDAEKMIKHWGERRKLCVSVKKLHGYGHLEEIVVKRADQQLHKFKEGDFVDLHLNDIKDMLLLDVQHKLFHLNDSDIVDFIVALRMFRRSLIIKRCVEDLQLGFSDRTLKTVHVELHHRIIDFCLGYNDTISRRKWMAIDKWRLELMVELIDKHMRERQIIRNLEQLVGARELKMDYKLMTRTV
ncbi:hypothetical protein Tco_0784714 [Tanacetum coccineum]